MTHKPPASLSLFQLIFITALLLLFGVTTYTLVSVGGSSYQRIMDAREENSGTRVALSYIAMRVRQNDAQDALALDPDNHALKLRMSDGIDVYEYRIYAYQGGLYECLVQADEPFDPLAGEYIAPIGTLELAREDTGGGTMLHITVRSPGGGAENSVGLLLRSSQEGGV